MTININDMILLCGTNVLVYSISTTQRGVNNDKKYYQHRHPIFEIHYIQSGHCRATCGGKSYYLEPGSMLLIPRGIYHDLVPTENSTRILCLSFNIQSKTPTGKSKSLIELFDRCEPTVVSLDATQAQHTVKRIAQLLENPQDDIFKNDKLLSLCGYLLLELTTHLTNTNAESSISTAHDQQEDINYKIDSFIGTNFMHNNAKSRIASDLYISPRQLQRIIQKNYGMSYRQKLAETRVQIAIDLLRNSDTPIHKISEILGYSCSANFSAFIKRTTGNTPSQIRKER